MTVAVSFWEDPTGNLQEWAEDVVNFIESFWEDPIGKLQEWARDLVSFVEDGLSSFTVVDWVLVALAAVAVFWVVASLRAMTRLGPIEVETLEHDGENKAAVKALTAALREQLADNGLIPPPAVPAGTPQVDLVAAVEASSIPQGAFIAKLMELLPKPPRPPEYKVIGVLVGAELTVDPEDGGPLPLAEEDGQPEDGSENSATGGLCGMSYWVRPSREGGALLDSTRRCDTHSQAVAAAASEIYMHISNDAVHAFPVWARWRTDSSLRAYLRGCRLHRRGLLRDAVAELSYAARQEPFNALAPLGLANIYERCVPGEPALERARVQTLALRSYLKIADDWPVLVEARYRASVVAGALATTCEDPDLGDVALTSISNDLSLPGVEAANLVDKLRDLAARESKAVRQLLKPWYALLREGRLRNQFEQKAHERRELGHTVSISKHCVRMRALCGRAGWRHRLEIRYRTAAVRFGHLGLGRGHLSWQARYNACCFDALLLAHLRRLSRP